eukprot:1360039-Alexandrium_andersonii.AAC.1
MIVLIVVVAVIGRGCALCCCCDHAIHASAVKFTVVAAMVVVGARVAARKLADEAPGNGVVAALGAVM